MDEVLQYLQNKKHLIMEDLEFLVCAESPSHKKEMVDQCGEVMKALFRSRLGLEAEVLPQQTTGDHLRFTYGYGDSQILILTHFDTVWEAGRLSFRLEGNKAYGPGILDMKAGIIQVIWAVKACKDLGVPIRHKIVFLCTSDEEISSITSRDLIEKEAILSRVVLVPEPAAAHTGALKTARKGVGRYTIKIKGIASHSGNHHDDGISAVEEMAHQILYLHSLTNYSKGTTINVGVANGGTRANIVADQAEIHVDARMTSREEAERISSLIHGIKPHLVGISLSVHGGITRPVMVRTAQTEQLFLKAALCGAELGLVLEETAAGGGSDGSFTAQLGIPTLDGIGAVGEGPHAEHEHILLSQLPVRTALFAKLLSRL
ncbi:M20/M25/M40 family metallo-hydrolase [Paenibacillus sp. LMG 31456]|uniref:M20/M25/M40 family metallo-hydrolase n=1 Tax=Paenibacillus foliorum TaxID=2654974 RepID=A0A972GYL2_9BACL|nr:M20 family metallopeptidase [Paenibacillus foliorum]NOU96182.1 M20/M25/M40 family metallo-hydrolase [Paenibacillus foliorum]